VFAVAVSSDGRLLASGGADNMVRVWDLATNKVIKNFSGHTGPVTVCLPLVPLFAGLEN
jgi:WD40 repeat protein